MAIKFVPISHFDLAKNKPKAVEVVYKDGKTCRFPTAYEASRLMGVPQPNIVACLKGRLKTAGGYVWRILKMANENVGKFHRGTRFRGNVNGAEMEVVRIEDKNAVIKDLQTGRVFSYGLKALEHCDVEVTGCRMKSG